MASQISRQSGEPFFRKPREFPQRFPNGFPIGKKTDEWNKVRRILKIQFAKVGITTCELTWDGCYKDNLLGFAHAKKRRNLEPEELKIAILVCNCCHDKLDTRPHVETEKIVMTTIRKRTRQP